MGFEKPTFFEETAVTDGILLPPQSCSPALTVLPNRCHPLRENKSTESFGRSPGRRLNAILVQRFSEFDIGKTGFWLHAGLHQGCAFVAANVEF